MDAQSLRRALHDFFKFNPKDFFVQGSGTGFLVSAAKKSGNSTSYCFLGVYNASTTDDPNQASCRWGTINKQQPSGFDTHGLVIPVLITEFTYFQAKATFSSSGDTISTEIVSGPSEEVNTSTEGYETIGTAEIVDDKLSIGTSCGNVVINFCDLPVV